MADAGVRVDLAPDPRSAKRARLTVTAVCDEAGVDGDLAALCTSELVTNALLHGRPPMTLAVAVMSGRLRVEVHDAASADAVARRDSIAENPTSGRGLAVLDALASRWGVDPLPAGKSVWFEIDLDS